MAKSTTETALSSRQILNDQRVLTIPGLNLKLCIWNLQEMANLKINILAIGKARWPCTEQHCINHKIMFFSIYAKVKHKNGVAIILGKQSGQAVEGFIPISERIMMLQLKRSHARFNLNIRSDINVETFYQQFDYTLFLTKPINTTAMFGAFKAKIRVVAVGKIVGDLGLGLRNESGDRLIQFC